MTLLAIMHALSSTLAGLITSVLRFLRLIYSVNSKAQHALRELTRRRALYKNEMDFRDGVLRQVSCSLAEDLFCPLPQISSTDYQIHRRPEGERASP
jgi:hypothetical protein